MKWIHRLILTSCLVAVICGCAQVQHRPPAQSPPSLDLRNNAASLLFDLLSDEKNVSKVLIIKRDREQLHQLITKISSVCGDAYKRMAQLADKGQELNLHVKDLPPGEKATREAESKSKEKELLHSSGAEFEFMLLLTQVEALNYGSHLARVAAENSSVPDEAQEFGRISSDLHELYEQTLALLRSPPNR